VTYISGDVPQNKRLSALERFKSGQVPVLVATDVAGRGLHIVGLGLVVNYTLPEIADDYIHRIGRTGRAGAKGVSVSFVSENDGFSIPELEKHLGSEIRCTAPPENLLA
jgi:ATP-dependent RNA helicase RhlB